MASATLNIKVSPRRMLQLKEAAEYCGIPFKRFPVECTVIPVAMPSGEKRYDMQDLDMWIDSLKSGTSSDDDAILGRLD